METISRTGYQSLASIQPKKPSSYQNIVVLKQLRYEELNDEFKRENRRLARMVSRLKKGLNKKIM